MNYHIDILSETAAVIPYTVSSAASKIITYGNLAGETVLEEGTMLVRGSDSISNTTVSGGGIGNFNGDGTDDVLLYNTKTGGVICWLVNDGLYESATGVGYAAPGWEIVGVDDFNHDGTDDVALRFSNDNEVYAWIVENGTCKDAIRIA